MFFHFYKEVEELIRAKIQKYDADKTGLVDFAFEPAGLWWLSVVDSGSWWLLVGFWWLLVVCDGPWWLLMVCDVYESTVDVSCWLRLVYKLFPFIIVVC